MPYAVALGWDLEDWRLAAGLDTPVRPEAAALIGASDLDDAEIEALQHHPILRLDASEMMEPGVAERVSAALRQRASEAAAWYLHVDLDVAGPKELPGGMTPAPFWPPRQHLLEAVRATVQSVPVRAASIAVYNPSLDINGRGLRLGLDMVMAMV
jgi:arginase family enzyme